MKRLLPFLLCILLPAPVRTLRAQEKEILAVTGAAAIEELDEGEYERLEALLTRPLSLNAASLMRLQSCGLFTRFQALSLTDYRRRNGDIRSVTELGLIDGFSPESAAALAPFLSFYSAQTGGGPERNRHRHEQLLRVERKTAGWGYAAKYRFTGKSSLQASATLRSSARERPGRPDTWSFNLTLPFRKRPGQLIVGDYSARFGQGLGLWSGFSLSGLTTAESFARHPTGFSPCWSLSPDAPLRGVAAELGFGRLNLSAAAAFPGLRARMDGNPAATVSALGVGNLSWIGRNAEASATLLAGETRRIAADFRWTPGTLSFFGEAALDLRAGVPGAVGGLIWSPAYQRKLSLVFRHYPVAFDGTLAAGVRTGSRCSGESGLAAGIRLPWLRMTADYARFPAKGQAQTKWLCQLPLTIRESLTLTPRCALRWRQGVRREEYRLEAAWAGTPWQAKARGDLVRCAGTAWLAYAEGGCKTARFSLYARAGIFKVDDWDDRIYVYERDVPGCFNVPAYYGRGYSASLNGGVRWRHHRLNWHAACIRYVGNKPRRSEYKLQYNFDF